MASRQPVLTQSESRYLLNQSWSFRVADGLSQRMERGRLLLFRPGLSLRLESFWHDVDGSLDDRCASVLRQVPHAAFGRLEEDEHGVRRFGFRVRNGIAECAGFHGITIGELGHVELVANLQDESEMAIVLSTWRSLREASSAISTTRPCTGEAWLIPDSVQKSSA